ncbi:MAG: hypothetical protein JXC85_03290 [Candidatus Aenigmarchaeota archaeon]|nr:hypothetical protein [Candidatus Aenigmarchaeota archaeon]
MAIETATNGGTGPPEPPAKKKRGYMVPVGVLAAMATILSVGYSICSHYDKSDAEAKLKTQFDNKKTELRAKFVDELRADPTKDVLAMVSRYGDEVSSYAAAFGQNDFETADDVSEFSENLEDVQREIAVPHARKARSDAQDAFDTYVTGRAKDVAGLYKPGMKEAEKRSLARSIYENVQKEAERGKDMGVEDPGFEQFIDKVSFFFDYDEGLRDIVKAAPRGAVFERFLDREMAEDGGFTCDVDHACRGFLDEYERHVSAYLNTQIIGLIDETGAVREGGLKDIEATLEKASQNSAEILQNE